MAPPPTLQELIETVRRDAGSDLPIDQLVVAATAAAQLEETTDALLGHFVDRCRRDGRSWTEISAALGVTKQAVHKRFASAMATQLAAASPRPTFERFTDRARHVLAESRQAAVGLGDGFVGTEHLLLALFSEPAGLAAKALAAMDVTEDSVRAAVAAAGPRTGEAAGDADSTGDASRAAGDADTPASGSAAGPAFSGAARRVLRDALAVALEFGHNYIGTEHLLLGLYRNEESLATRILTAAGALESTARAHISDMLRGFRQGT
jgi:ATP-dependent Clp protease ATP-binding subunit ClpA